MNPAILELLLGSGGRVPAWVQPGAIIDEDFYNSLAWPLPFATELADTRSSVQYVTTRAGILVPKLATVLPISDAGMLVEPSATNLFLQSNGFSTSWTQIGTVSLTPNFATSPDNTADAWRANAASGANGLFQSIAHTSGQPYTATLWTKSNGGGNTFRLFGDAGSAFSSNLTATGAVQRFSYTFTASATGSRSAGLNRDSVASAYDLQIFGCQIEAGSSPTSYITTTTASATRAANAITIQRTGIGRIVFTFDDNSQQTVSGINTAAQYTIPTNLSRPLIKRMTGYVS